MGRLEDLTNAATCQRCNGYGMCTYHANVRARDLQVMLKRVTDGFDQLHTCHWDTDGVQPEEKEEIEEQRKLITEARALMKAGGQ